MKTERRREGKLGIEKRDATKARFGVGRRIWGR